jgi:hypothetical protein
MSHNRRKNRIDDAFEPQLREEMLQAFWEATDAVDLEAWFTEPWRDGRNAARLCLHPFGATNATVAAVAGDAPREWLLRTIDKDHAQLTSEDYEHANTFQYEVSHTDGTRYGVFLDAALAIYANWIARSDGGGIVPNIHLSNAFGRILYSGELDEQEAHQYVGLWRSRDAGMDWMRIGDGSSAGRRAATHRWLWMNRRCQMADVFARTR